MSSGLVIVAAGSSHRMGGVDKVWAPLGAQPVVWYSLQSLSAVVQCTVLVVRPECVERAREMVECISNVEVVAGGLERHESVRRGLETLAEVDVVAVHDAARPFAPPSLLSAGIALLHSCDGAIPVLPVVDTLKRIDAAGKIETTVDRVDLRAAQTPQVFNGTVLRRVYSRWKSDTAPTDDATMLERCGHPVQTFPGAHEAFKITSGPDLLRARLLFASGFGT